MHWCHRWWNKRHPHALDTRSSRIAVTWLVHWVRLDWTSADDKTFYKRSNTHTKNGDTLTKANDSRWLMSSLKLNFLSGKRKKTRADIHSKRIGDRKKLPTHTAHMATGHLQNIFQIKELATNNYGSGKKVKTWSKCGGIFWFGNCDQFRFVWISVSSICLVNQWYSVENMKAAAFLRSESIWTMYSWKFACRNLLIFAFLLQKIVNYANGNPSQANTPHASHVIIPNELFRPQLKSCETTTTTTNAVFIRVHIQSAVESLSVGYCIDSL